MEEFKTVIIYLHLTEETIQIKTIEKETKTTKIIQLPNRTEETYPINIIFHNDHYSICQTENIKNALKIEHFTADLLQNPQEIKFYEISFKSTQISVTAEELLFLIVKEFLDEIKQKNLIEGIQTNINDEKVLKRLENVFKSEGIHFMNNEKEKMEKNEIMKIINEQKLFNERKEMMKKIPEEMKNEKKIEENEEKENVMKKLSVNERNELKLYKLDPYCMMIASKYLETIEDYINVELSSKKYRYTMEKFHYNPISLTESTLPLFPNVETLYIYKNEDMFFQCQKIKKYIVLCDIPYKKYEQEAKKGKQIESMKIILRKKDVDNYVKEVQKKIQKKQQQKQQQNQFGTTNVVMFSARQRMNSSEDDFDDFDEFENDFSDEADPYEELNQYIVPYGVNKIQKKCFDNCNFQTIIIPTNIIDIGDEAFSNCRNLKSIVLPSSITKLPKKCFSSNWNGNQIESIEIPNSVKEIGEECFSNCRSLTNVILSTSLKKLSKNCFNNCGLQGIKIPESIEELGENCFANCYSLTGIEFSNAITELLTSCFSNCNQLQQINFPTNLKVIGNYCFHNCGSLTGINLIETITKLGDNCFSNCNSLLNVEIPDNIIEIGNYCFSNCYSLTEVEVGRGLKSLSQGCFSQCQQLVNVQIPLNVTEFGERCFESCRIMNRIELPTDLTRLPSKCFDNCGFVEFTIPTHIKVVESNCFGYSPNLTKLNVDSKWSVNGNRLFNNDAYLCSFSIPNNIQMINSKKYSPKTFPSFKIPTYVTAIGDYCFSDCVEIKTMQLTTRIKAIGKGSFSNCNSMTSIQIPKTVKKLPEECFKNCRELTEIELHEEIEEIGKRCFSNCNSLTSIEFPDSLTTFDESWIENCRGLVEVYLPTGITELKNASFCNFNSLKVLEIPTGVTKLPQNCFQRCGFESFIIPETIKEIGTNCFSHSLSLTSIEFPSTMTTFNKNWIEGCVNLKKVILPGEIKTIPNKCFFNFSQLEEIVIPSGIKKLPEYCFANCSKLKNINIESTIESIERGCFMGCETLELPSTPLIIESENKQIPMNEKEKEQIGEWTGLHIKNVLYDSEVDDFRNYGTMFQSKLVEKSQLVLIMETNNELKIGTFINSEITQVHKWIKDSNSFIFSMKKDEQVKFNINKAKKYTAFYLYPQQTNNYIFKIGFSDISVSRYAGNHYYGNQRNENNKLSFNYEGNDKSKYFPNSVDPKRIVILQMA